MYLHSILLYCCFGDKNVFIIIKADKHIGIQKEGQCLICKPNIAVIQIVGAGDGVAWLARHSSFSTTGISMATRASRKPCRLVVQETFLNESKMDCLFNI